MSLLFFRVFYVRCTDERTIKENLLAFRGRYAVLFPILQIITFIPLKAYASLDKIKLVHVFVYLTYIHNVKKPQVYKSLAIISSNKKASLPKRWG